jgi:hypothetical protein
MVKISFGIAAYVVFTFILAYSWNMLLFRESYLSLASSSLRSAPIMQLGLVSVLIEGVVLSLLFSMYYKGGDPLTEGVLLGLLVGTFSIGYAGLVVPAKFVIEPIWKYSILELGFGIIHFGLAGVFLGYIFNRST